jgi:dTDP-glucose 4,6-dehydratase
MSSRLQQIIEEDCELVTRDSIAALESLRDETVLITGGTGFVGTWLASLIAYLNDKHRFRTKVILLSSRAQNFSAKAPTIALRSDVLLVEKDIRSLLEMPETVSWVIHGAGSPDNRLHASDPETIVDVIVTGTKSSLAAAARLPNLKKFLNISSGLIYGPQPWEMETMPESFRGSLDCGSISSAYAEAKRLSETLCAIYRSQQKLPVVNVRPFAFIGPYQLLDRPWAINNFIRDSLLGGPIRILGDGETVRSYMYPSDMAFWLLAILVKGAIGASYNIGSPHGISLNRVAEKIASELPQRPRITSRMASDRGVPPSKFVPDVSLAQSTLGLGLKVDLDTAIKRTLLWNQVQR